jgi:hypothetical protein
MSIDAMKAELIELNKQAVDLGWKRRDLRQRIANSQALFKVGDRVTYDGALHVWEIQRIGVDWNDKPRYIGAKIKKDGTPGKQATDIFTPHKATLRAV